MRNTPKVVGGLTDACTRARRRALRRRSATRSCAVSTPEAAELSKLLENIFRSVNIALVNEIAMLADRMGIDIWEVVDAADTKPYGFMRFEPGPGHGRPLPAGRSLLPGLEGARVRRADRVHRARRQGQPEDAATSASRRSSRALNDHEKPVKGSKVAIVGVSYKGGVGDMRESPALKIIACCPSAARGSSTTTSSSPSCRSSG